jgi:hypothetical protein
MRLSTLTIFSGSILVCCLFLLSQPSKADTLPINVGEVKVYSQPNTNSEVITTLFKGDHVPVSKKEIPLFKKVLITDGSNKKVGYIRNADLFPRGAPGAAVRGVPRGSAKGPFRNQVGSRNFRKLNRNMHKRYALGLSAGVNYQYQNSRTYSDASGANVAIGTLSGANFELAGFFDIPFSYNFKLHSYFALKTVNVTGTATYQLGTVPALPESTILNETFLTVGALGEIYPSSRSNWWWGLGLQIDHGMNGSLTFGSFPPTTLQGSDLPNFVLGQVAIGYDFNLGGNIFLIPAFKLGGVLNALPIIFEGDFLLDFAYAF